MYVLDQALRNGSIGFPAALCHSMSPHAWNIFQTLMAEDTRALDRTHTSLMKSYIKTHAFPTKRAAGAETQSEIWTLVQHGDADPLFQYSVLKKMQRLLPQRELAEPRTMPTSTIESC